MVQKVKGEEEQGRRGRDRHELGRQGRAAVDGVVRSSFRQARRLDHTCCNGEWSDSFPQRKTCCYKHH